MIKTKEQIHAGLRKFQISRMVGEMNWRDGHCVTIIAYDKSDVNAFVDYAILCGAVNIEIVIREG